jgi:hypothetical protein
LSPLQILVLKENALPSMRFKILRKDKTIPDFSFKDLNGI